MLGLSLVAIAEGDHLQKAADPAFSLFPVLFEIVSAYGTVGLSLGVPETETSLYAQFNWVSKLVFVAMQLRGRHRGLPHAWIMPFCCHVNLVKMVGMNGWDGWELGSRGVPRI
jgi:Trk-type K+ transport system membrane component